MMDEKVIFRELLKELREKAEEQENTLSKEEVKKFLGEGKLNQEQMELVYDYLQSAGIKIPGYHGKQEEILQEEVDSNKKDNTLTSSKETPEFMMTSDKVEQLYHEDLASLPEVKEGEINTLYQQILKGDSLSKSRLIESYLHTVAEVVKEHKVKGTLFNEMIQEGNLALLLAVEELESKRPTNVGSYLEHGIRQGIKRAFEEQDLINHAQQELAQRANYLKEATTHLEEDLERKVTMEELAQYLEMTKEEVAEVIGMTGGEISLEDFAPSKED